MKYLALACCCLVLSSCEFVDAELLKGTREYFPDAEVIKPRRNVIHIETHVGHVSQQFVADVFQTMQQTRGRDIARGMAFSGYQFLVLGFDDFNVVWTPQSTGASVMDAATYSRWWTDAFGADMNTDYGRASKIGVDSSILEQPAAQRE